MEVMEGIGLEKNSSGRFPKYIYSTIYMQHETS